MSTLQVDPDGDLRLAVMLDGHDKTFQVSSKAMSLASPVWRTMLDPNGPFREGKPDNSGIASPDDDAEALLILFLAAHLRNDEVPESVSFDQLLNICVLCDKYDCVRLVRSWISKWATEIKPVADDPEYEEWLLIAWTTGDVGSFERLARRIVRECVTNDLKQCLIGSGKILSEDMPPGVTESDLEARRTTVVKVVNLCESLLDKYGPGKSACHNVKPSSFEACESLVYGCLIRGLHRLQLWPISANTVPSLASINVATLLANVGAIKCFTYPAEDIRFHGRLYHDQCGFGSELKEEIAKIQAAIPSGIDESHRIHMESQSQRLSQSDVLLRQLQQDDTLPLSDKTLKAPKDLSEDMEL